MKVQGMHRETGKLIDDREHLTQSIWTILSTPLGSRVMRPEFGSELPDLIDEPMTPTTNLRIYAATIDALNRWEPRFLTQNVQVTKRAAAGIFELKLKGDYYGEQIEIDGIQLGRATRP